METFYFIIRAGLVLAAVAGLMFLAGRMVGNLVWGKAGHRGNTADS